MSTIQLTDTTTTTTEQADPPPAGPRQTDPGQSVQERVEPLGSDEAWALASKICAAAGLAARSQCALLELIGEFDATDGVRWWQDIKSLAHWLSWTCSMSPGTAREHVRVARALRAMPTTTAAFRDGRLSYSKVRELTRVVGIIDETRLCDLALTATASQLARMVSAYRGAAGHRIKLEDQREFRSTERESGLVDLRIRLPKEEAAIVLAAINAAKDHHTPDTHGQGADQANNHTDRQPDGQTDRQPDGPVDAAPPYGMVDAVLDLARDYLATAPPDRSGEDRTTVVVHVAAEQVAIAPQPGNVPAGTPPQQASTTNASTDTEDGPATRPAPIPDPQDVPAGTSPPTTAPDPVCHLQGLGGIDPETARKLACDPAGLIGAIKDAHGDVLALGRTRRLVTRALMIRDHGLCQYPGCHQTRHLKAHHIVHWANGGPTDLDNLILLCQFHHTTVHEGNLTITQTKDRPGQRWTFRLPDGTTPRHWWSATTLARELARHAERQPVPGTDQHTNPQTDPTADPIATIDAVDHWDHPDAARIRPRWAGEPFDLHACVEALFTLQLPTQHHHKLAA